MEWNKTGKLYCCHICWILFSRILAGIIGCNCQHYSMKWSFVQACQYAAAIEMHQMEVAVSQEFNNISDQVSVSSVIICMSAHMWNTYVIAATAVL